MGRFRMVVMDLDSTLLDWNGDEATIGEEAKEVLTEVVERQIITVIATGRSVRTSQLELETQSWSWGRPVPHFLIAFEKYCYRVQDGKNIEDGRLKEWNDERRREGRSVIQEIILPNWSRWLQALEERGLTPKHWSLDTGAGWLTLSYPDSESAKVATDFLEILAAPFPQIKPNRNNQITGLIPKMGSKGVSLKFLADHLGIACDQIVTIGDGMNDWDMLDGRFGFFPVAVANAEEAIKRAVLQAGGLVTEQPASLGVSEAIKRLILDHTRGD
ncbi:MAG: Cof-type HAD-IIB family hydrolase [Armatimonadetes bacterium]|nr:Cof-type HAD-IIB family hydrolase [Armatimonadota bacterium]MDW8121887.1 HAD family hydrolase [Armatimonadota bacterium]